MTINLYKTTKGYVIEVYRFRQTVAGEIACYSFKGERQMVKVRSNDKGSYIEVRQKGKYYGRCFI